jgi:hypothetical protein
LADWVDSTVCQLSSKSELYARFLTSIKEEPISIGTGTDVTTAGLAQFTVATRNANQSKSVGKSLSRACSNLRLI